MVINSLRQSEVFCEVLKWTAFNGGVLYKTHSGVC